MDKLKKEREKNMKKIEKKTEKDRKKLLKHKEDEINKELKIVEKAYRAGKRIVFIKAELTHATIPKIKEMGINVRRMEHDRAHLTKRYHITLVFE